MTQDREELKRLAEAAYHDYGLADIAVGGGMRATVSVPAFITAASPSTVLSLISDLEARDAEIESLSHMTEVSNTMFLQGQARLEATQEALRRAAAVFDIYEDTEEATACRQALSKEPEA